MADRSTIRETHWDSLLSGRDLWRWVSDKIEPVPTGVERHYFVFVANSIYQQKLRERNASLSDEGELVRHVNEFVTYLESQVGDLAHVRGMNYKWWVLRLYDAQGKEICAVNAVSVWDNIDRGNPEMDRIASESRRKAEELREDAMADSLFGGSVVVKYAGAAGALSITADTTTAFAGQTLNTAHRTIVKVGKLFVKTPTGALEPVYLGDKLFLDRWLSSLLTGERSVVRQNTMRILERLWYVFDPVNKWFRHVSREVFESTVRLVQTMTPREFAEKYRVQVSEVELLQLRTKLVAVSKGVADAGYSLASISKAFSGKLMHAVMFPVFFSTFTRHQTSATLAAGLSEWALFTAGAKAGAKVGKFGGMLWKIGTPIVLGWAAVMGWKEAWERVEGNQKKWEMFNGTDMYSEKRSIALHAAVNWWVPEALAYANEGEGESLNIGVPSMNLGKILPEWWGKHIPMTAETWITPEITFVQSRVHLGVDPGEWMGGSRYSRTINQWNIEVTRYKEELLRQILSLVVNYQKYVSPFLKSNGVDKNRKLFSELLQAHVLHMWESRAWWSEQGMIHDAVFSELSRWQDGRSSLYIKDIVDNYVSGMYLDETTFASDKMRQELERQDIVERMAKLSLSIVDEGQSDYFLWLLERIEQHERLFEPDSLDVDEYGEQKLVLSHEHKLFLALLKDVTPVSTESGVQRTVGFMVAHLLDRMSDYVIHRENMDRLSKISGDTPGAHWLEEETIRGVRH